MKKKAFPKELYVTIDYDGNEHYFVTHRSYKSAAELGSLNTTIRVAKYALVESGEVITKAEWKRIPR